MRRQGIRRKGIRLEKKRERSRRPKREKQVMEEEGGNRKAKKGKDGGADIGRRRNLESKGKLIKP